MLIKITQMDIAFARPGLDAVELALNHALNLPARRIVTTTSPYGFVQFYHMPSGKSVQYFPPPSVQRFITRVSFGQEVSPIEFEFPDDFKFPQDQP